MRTTVAIDDDIARELRKQAEKQNVSFTKALNRVLRAGLQRGKTKASKRPIFRVEPIDVEFRPGIDPYRLKELLVEEEAVILAEKLRDHP